MSNISNNTTELEELLKIANSLPIQEDLNPELLDQDSKISMLQQAITSKVSATVQTSDDGNGNVTIASGNLSFYID